MSTQLAAAAVPVRPAATVMIVDDRPDLHVLLLRRRAGSQFVPGMDVFPGGGVDASDAAPAGDACLLLTSPSPRD
jgi:recombination protein RecT